MASSYNVLNDNDSVVRQDPNKLIPSSSEMSVKRSWQSINHTVHSARKLHAKFANSIPHQFSFIASSSQSEFSKNPNSKNKPSNLRVLFLGILKGNYDRTLLYVDIPLSDDQCYMDSLPEWKQVFKTVQLSSSQTGSYSKEEELYRERKRLSVSGITNYQISHDNSYVLFPACGSLFTMKLDDIGRVEYSFHRRELVMAEDTAPMEVISRCKGARMDPKISPNNSKLIAYVHENDIWVTHIESKAEKRLTFAHTGCSRAVDDAYSAGVASYIIQEEFDRYSGYWWQPNSQKDQHRMIFELVDESDVDILSIADPVQCGIDHYRYPKAGKTNAHVSLRLLEFTTSSCGKIHRSTVKKLPQSLKSLFPWMEYILRVEWIPDGRGVWVWILDRLQQRSAIIYIPVDQFRVDDQTISEPIDPKEEDFSDIDMIDHNDDAVPSPIRILYEEFSEIWINVHDSYHLFEDNESDEINFIFASEASGFRHLYHINAQLTPPLISSSSEDVNSEVSPCPTTVTQLTSGNWEVLGLPESIWVDTEAKQVYFMALKDSVLETNLYRVPYDVPTPSTPARLLHPGCTHSVQMSKDNKHFIAISSSVGELFSAKVYSQTPQHQTALANLIEPTGVSQKYPPPELFSFVNSSGTTLHGFYHKPVNYEAGKKYPTVLYVYGGPHVQLVSNAFKVFKHHRLYTLASMGYAVVSIDGRGSAHRGVQFESHLKHKMGQIEIDDQVDGLEWLNENVGFIDMSRIAIHGWSYGGYLSLMGLAQRSDIFKVAISGAPVVRWEDYDTGYTERYMGTPDSNPEGYERGSVLHYLSGFPNDPNRLLLVHGLIDENVHFTHTAQLINALVQKCKPYQLQVYPSERHGIRNLSSNEHFEVAVLYFLQQYL